jgi:hypothetical protein
MSFVVFIAFLVLCSCDVVILIYLLVHGIDESPVGFISPKSLIGDSISHMYIHQYADH